jgi:hypothetical protein
VTPAAARRLSSRGLVSQTQVYVLDAGGMLYQLTIDGPAGPEGDALAQSFELLE